MGKYIVAAVLLAAIAGPAFAQQSMPDDPIILDALEKKKEREALEKRYNSTLRNTEQTVAPVKNDPWANMRGTENSKTKR